MQSLSRLDNLTIIPTHRYGTWYEATEEFCLPHDQIEEYNVLFKDMLVATFWLANNFEDSIILHIPVDVTILNYILEQMKIRRFSRLNA